MGFFIFPNIHSAPDGLRTLRWWSHFLDDSRTYLVPNVVMQHADHRGSLAVGYRVKDLIHLRRVTHRNLTTPWKPQLTHWPLGGFDWSLKLVNFKLISPINIWSIYCEIAIRWIPQYLTDQTLVQVMAWCHEATSHYLSQCWPRSLSPYDVTRPQWVKPHYQKRQNGRHFTDNIFKCISLNKDFWILTISLKNVP